MRQAGLLMSIQSMPNQFGIGDFGPKSYEFVDLLKKTGMKIWQILPLGPTGYGDSPYQSFSTFAGNPNLIDLDMLVQEKLISQDEINKIDSSIEFGISPAGIWANKKNNELGSNTNGTESYYQHYADWPGPSSR